MTDTHRHKMKYINSEEYSPKQLKQIKAKYNKDSGPFPMFPSAHLKLKRCIKCNKLVCANYYENDYECFKCRKENMWKIEYKLEGDKNGYRKE